MPRPATMMSETRKTIRDNQSQGLWLSRTHALLIQQLKMLAKTMDQEMATTGMVKSATASQYRLTVASLAGMDEIEDDLPEGPQPTAGAQPEIDDDPEGLFGPR